MRKVKLVNKFETTNLLYENRQRPGSFDL